MENKCVCVLCVCVRAHCYVLLLYLSGFQLHVSFIELLTFYCKMCLMFYVNYEPEGKFFYT